MSHDNQSDGGITVGELIEQLKLHPKNNPLYFGTGEQLTFYRVKDRSGATQIEFNEIITEVERPDIE
jgi:hypothetical protein